MSSLVSETERQGILAVFEQSFDTWCRDIIVYKEPLKSTVAPSPDADNVFGFGDNQQDPVYTFSTPVTGYFKAVIKDPDIESATRQASEISPEIIARIVNNPISMKVRADAHRFLEDGPNQKVVDILGEITYYVNGHPCLQTYMGSKYWVYPLRRSL
jgi:hypothetical protein